MKNVPFLALALLLYLLVLPVLLLTWPLRYLQRTRFQKKYKSFLEEHNGKNFFCYNNKRSTQPFVETAILPCLGVDIEVVFLNGKRVETTYDTVFMAEALYQLQHYQKFPHLMKIREGKLLDQSVNNLFYSVLKGHKPKAKLLDQMNNFFDLPNTKQ